MTDITLEQNLLIALIIIGGTIIHGVAGFGFAQVSMGLMPLFLSAVYASGIFTPLAFILNVRVWWSVKNEFRWKDWLRPVIGLIFGMPIGIYLLNNLNEQQMKLSIAAVLFIGVFLIGFMKKSEIGQRWIHQSNFKPGLFTGIIAGFIAGVLGGAVAMPGPSMIVYGSFMLAAGYWKAERMKAVFTAFFGTLMLYRFVYILYTGQINIEMLKASTIALPGLFLGSWIGIKIYNRIPRNIFSWLVLGMLSILALLLLIKGL